VNHSGDSDSTGSLVGNIVGALYGDRAIPERWLADLELRPVIESVAQELAALACA
jgi:ADP-ribosyl-[dinitrogen reductase] hydrolase